MTNSIQLRANLNASESIWFELMLRRIYLAVLVCASVSLVLAQSPTVPGKPLPPGPMQAKVKAACTQCHNTGRIAEQHLTREQWVKELKKMDGLGANIPPADRNALLNYLAKNFGPTKAAGAGDKTEAKKRAN
jgi:hypothetical protein